jgi:hypothetical protein
LNKILDSTLETAGAITASQPIQPDSQIIPTQHEDEMATVLPENSRDAFDRGGRAKSVIISGDKIKGSQG